MGHVPRLYLPGVRPGPLTLTGDQAQRLAAVMRLRVGDAFLVFGGEGREWEATVRAVGKGTLAATVGAPTRQEPPPALEIEAWVGLVRPNRFDWAVEKCTEAGAGTIRPLLSEFGTRGEGASASRLERWERLAVEAAEQSGRLRVPVIATPTAFETLLAHPRGAIFVADREGRPWQEARELLPAMGSVVVAVGPEGGFAPGEVALAKARGAVLFSLGPNILRTETAAAVAVAMVRAERPWTGAAAFGARDAQSL